MVEIPLAPHSTSSWLAAFEGEELKSHLTSLCPAFGGREIFEIPHAAHSAGPEGFGSG